MHTGDTSTSQVSFPTRRHFLAGSMSALALGAAGLGWPAPAHAGTAQEPFDFERLSERMREAARSDHVPAKPALPEAFGKLDYDAYRLIQFRNERARWQGAAHDFRIQAFHPGWLYQEPVKLFEIVDGKSRTLSFSEADFRYRGRLADIAAKTELSAVAGLRLHHPLDASGALTELASFVGASYFRALGRGNEYGSSARGIALNTWAGAPEEFPRFSEFYLEQPAPDGPLTLFAALKGESLTGAYRMVISPASATRAETVMEITARLYFRKDIEELGIAPLTSMYLFGQTNRDDFDDYRPQVHDANGLMVERTGGEVLWRPLDNTATLGNSYLAETDPVSFGLYQRDRQFEQFQDPGARYERRPSIRVEPIGDWGRGTVRLIEIPARLEADDNIVAYWIPDRPARAGESMEFSYRLVWGDLPVEDDVPLAHVVETRAGRGGAAGIDTRAGLRKFVIDFSGGSLDAMPAGQSLDVFHAAAGGRIVNANLTRLPEAGIWRLVIDAAADGDGPVELKAYLIGGARVLTETWIYQWRPEE